MHPLPGKYLPLACCVILMLMQLHAHCKNNLRKIGTAQFDTLELSISKYGLGVSCTENVKLYINFRC